SGPFSIGSFDLFHTQVTPGTGTYAPGTYNIFFVTTSLPIAATNPIFANNETTPLVLFATLVIAPGTLAAASTFNIAGTPFLYNPNLGNLLLYIKYSNTSSGLFLDSDRTSIGLMSRVFGSGTTGTVSVNFGLVTRFNGVTTPGPQPSSSARRDWRSSEGGRDG